MMLYLSIESALAIILFLQAVLYEEEICDITAGNKQYENDRYMCQGL